MSVDEKDLKDNDPEGKKFLRLGMLKDPLFLLFCAREFTTLLVIDSFYVFSIDLMVQKGEHKKWLGCNPDAQWFEIKFQ